MLSVDMIDEAGEVVSDDGSTGMKLSGIESMNLHKQRLAPTGRVQSSRDYKLPPPDMIAVVAGMLVSDSSQVGSACPAPPACSYTQCRLHPAQGSLRFPVHGADRSLALSGSHARR